MPETAINTPFEANEVKDIACAEFRKRLDSLSPLSGTKEYAAFSLVFDVKIGLRRSGDAPEDAKETLAWAVMAKPHDHDFTVNPETVEEHDIHSTFESKEPNEERVERDMPLTVESPDGKGGKMRRKVRIKV